MIKLFALLAVLAVLPVSALAGQIETSNNSAIHCMKDQPDTAYTQAPVAAVQSAANDATIAR